MLYSIEVQSEEDDEKKGITVNKELNSTENENENKMETEDEKPKDDSFEDGQIAEEDTPSKEVKVEKPVPVIY